MGTLRLTGGTLRSRSVKTPSGRAVRPTPARVKEALFSILADRIADANVLDLFAGSGALGFEALSRGAAHATFVEQHRPTADALRGSAQALGLADRTTVLAMPAERAARMRRRPLRRGVRRPAVRRQPTRAPRSPRCASAARSTNARSSSTSTVARRPAPADPAFALQRDGRVRRSRARVFAPGAG